MTSPPARPAGLLVLALAALASACGFTGGHPGQAAPAASGAAARRDPAAGLAPAGPPAGTAAPAGTAPAGTAGPAGPPAGRQLVTVTAASYGATYASLSAYQRAGGRWRRVLGPWTARIGRNGFAAPGHKREGDGKTPSGSFRIQFFFGALPNPGVRFGYRRAHGYDFWDDDPASPRYNEWVDSRHAGPGRSPEPMDVSGYDYGAVIGYNAARTPGLGSGIFLHVNIGIATAGCVTLPMAKLLAVLRWLDPARSPRIRMGVR